MVDRDEDSEIFGDSSCDSCGGFSLCMKLWWYIEWPEEVRKRTFKYLKNRKSNDFIDINVLEYATVLFSYAAAHFFWVIENHIRKLGIPYPSAKIWGDNTQADMWMNNRCKTSLIG